MRLVQRIRCLFGKHLRSRGSAIEDGSGYTSVCVGCGQAMEKRLGIWRTKD